MKISLYAYCVYRENILISDIDVIIDESDKMQFVFDDPSTPIQMKMCDLGLSEIFKNSTDDKCCFLSTKNAGKHNYKIPEIIAHKKAFNARSNDIWCLGIASFMMLIGGSP